MRPRFALLLVVLAVVVAGDTSLASTERARLPLRSRLAIELPEGWSILHTRLATCSDPVQRLAIATFPPSRLGEANAVPHSGVLVLVLEDHTNPRSAFSPRAAVFRRPDRATSFEGCCDTPTTPGYEFMFRDHGRDFEAFVFLGTDASDTLVDQALSILRTLQVDARR